MSEFVECDTCRAKPGTPTLCAECLRRRAICELASEESSRLTRLAMELKITEDPRIRIGPNGEVWYRIDGIVQYVTKHISVSFEH